MAPDRRGGRLTPEQISRASFATSFRGFDADQVRQYLGEIADELREQRDQEAALRAELESLEAKVAASTGELDEDALTAALGEETARVLTAAREASTQIKAKGEESVARMLREAQDEAGRLRTQAEGVLAEKTSAAEAAAAQVTAAADERAATTTADADAAAQSTRAAAEQVLTDARAAAEKTHNAAAEAAAAELEKAREEGRTMVQEAQLVRERVLKDLARKRKTARAQLEQLRAGRERLLEAYELVRRTLGEATGELAVALTEAKFAADAAVRRVEEEPEPTVEELEAEVEAARMAGLPIIDRSHSPAFDPDLAPAPSTAEDASPETPATAAPVASEAPAAAAPADELPPLPDDIPPPLPTLDPIRPPKRRRKRGVPDLPPTELQPMSPRDPVEGMRVITGEVPVVAVGKQAPAEASIAAESPAESPAADEVAADDAAVEVEAAPGGEASSDDEITDETEVVDVDDLFARIRAARADEVEKANEILDSAAKEAEAEAQASDETTAAEADEAAEPDATSDDEAVLERRDGVVDAIEQAATRKLKRVLADEQSDVLDRLRRTRTPTLDALYADGLDGQLAKWSAAAGPDLEEAALAGAAFHGGDGATPRPTADLAAELAADLVNPLRDRVESSLRDSDGDEETAADGIRAAYREWKSKRIADHTRDAVFGAFGRGLYDAASDGATARWLVDDGGVPCPDCDDNALAGAIAKGEPFPTGHCHPPAHPGCRCLLLPL